VIVSFQTKPLGIISFLERGGRDNEGDEGSLDVSLMREQKRLACLGQEWYIWGLEDWVLIMTMGDKALILEF